MVMSRFSLGACESWPKYINELCTISNPVSHTDAIIYLLQLGDNGILLFALSSNVQVNGIRKLMLNSITLKYLLVIWDVFFSRSVLIQEFFARTSCINPVSKSNIEVIVNGYIQIWQGWVPTGYSEKKLGIKFIEWTSLAPVLKSQYSRLYTGTFLKPKHLLFLDQLGVLGPDLSICILTCNNFPSGKPLIQLGNLNLIDGPAVKFWDLWLCGLIELAFVLGLLSLEKFL